MTTTTTTSDNRTAATLDALGLPAMPEVPADLAADFRETVCGTIFQASGIPHTHRVSDDARRRAAEGMHAGADHIGVTLKLWPRPKTGPNKGKHPEPLVLGISSLISQARLIYTARTFDLPAIPGVRLIRTDRVERLEADLATVRAELVEHLAQARAQWTQIVARTVESVNARSEAEAAEDNDGPPPLITAADLPIEWLNRPGWEFSTVEISRPPAGLPPELYAAHLERIERELRDAYESMLDAVTVELGQHVDLLRDNLRANVEGTKKIQPRRLASLLEFFGSFRDLPQCPETLREMVHRAELVAQSLGDPAEMTKTGEDWRRSAADRLAGLSADLAPMIEPARRRVTFAADAAADAAE